MGWLTEARDGGHYPKVELGGGNSCPGDCGFQDILINEVILILFLNTLVPS